MIPRARLVRAALALVLLGTLASSCAYYNTFYLARKNYFKGTDGAPYVVDKAQPNQAAYFTKSVEYAKKVLANYPKSKWVDDAYVLWAKSLLGQNDPLQTVNMLQDFATRYPNSALGAEATFFLGVGYRQAHRYPDALHAFDDFLSRSKHHDLVPYALLERSRVLVALQRPGDAAAAAGELLERFPKSKLVVEARKGRAEALFSRGDFAKAREDYAYLGANSLNDEDRLTWLFREADCLEGLHDFDGSIALLKSALSHETEPVPPPSVTSSSTGAAPPSNTITTTALAPGADHFGRLEIRIGTANLLAGRLDPALEAYRAVQADYPRTLLGAEAQFRIGYAYETVGDDFEKAHAEYAKVKEQGAGGVYGDQANQRLATLDRLSHFKGAGRDSTERRAEVGFARAEVYLFQLDKPERALQEYQRVAEDMKGTPYEAKALTAQAWVLSRKLDRRPEADSLLWVVVRKHPATEAQLAARDYLEAEGADVPQDLIKMPERPLPVAVDTTRLTPPPAADNPLGHARMSPADSARAAGSAWQQAMYHSAREPLMRADSTGRTGPGLPPRFMPSGGYPGGPADTSFAGPTHAPVGGPAHLPPGVAADSAAARFAPPRGPALPRTRADSLAAAVADSIRQARRRRIEGPLPVRATPADSAHAAGATSAPAPADSTRAPVPPAPAPADSTRAPVVTPAPKPDAAPADSTLTGAPAPAPADSAAAPVRKHKPRKGEKAPAPPPPPPAAAPADSAGIAP